MDVADRQATAWGVVFATLLHLGLLVFLLLATISCNTWQQAIEGLGLPGSWNPVTCHRLLSLPGPVIEATLLGPTGAPQSGKAKRPKSKAKPSPAKASRQKTERAVVKTLPPPPMSPDIRDQQKVVAQSSEQAEQAQRKQRERERQRMSELDAQQDQDIDKLFRQMDSVAKRSRQADRTAQRLAQRNDLKKDGNSPDTVPAGTPKAEQTRSGTAGTDSGMLGQYHSAIQSAVTQAWLRPDNIPVDTICKVDIVQIVGGQVISANVESNCPFGATARRSVENAVMRASPLPYHGFEKVFSRQLTLHFMVNE